MDKTDRKQQQQQKQQEQQQQQQQKRKNVHNQINVSLEWSLFECSESVSSC